MSQHNNSNPLDLDAFCPAAAIEDLRRAAAITTASLLAALEAEEATAAVHAKTLSWKTYTALADIWQVKKEIHAELRGYRQLIDLYEAMAENWG